MMAHPHLPDRLPDKCVAVLEKISPNEQDLIRVIVEVISELRDPEGESADIEQVSTLI